MDKILLIDFMNFVYRCQVGKLDGEYVVIYNFFRNLRAIIEQFKPDKLFFVLEGRPKHRYEIFADYKANRIIKIGSKVSKKDIILLSNNIKKLLLLLPITLAYHYDFEADDVIATLCSNMSNENVIILSSDSDYIQLLQLGYKNCELYNPIIKDFLKPPHYPYVAWKALAGDKSDNIPNLVSEKKAIQLMNASDLFKKFLSLEENRSNFNINRSLIEFRAVPIEEIILEEGEKDFDSLKEKFIEMEFNSIVNEKNWKKFYQTFDCLKF